MTLTINGVYTELDEHTTVAEYLRVHHYNVKTLVVELNEQIISASMYGETVLKDGDIMEIVTFMGGG